MKQPRPILLIASHAGALLLGLAGAGLVADSVPRVMESVVAVVRSPSRARPPQAARLSSPEDIRQAIQQLDNEPVSPADREALRAQLYDDWARRDPAGLLAFLEQCPVWPESLSPYLPYGLARERPDLVLDFALRTGSSNAAFALRDGDPQTVSRLIEALPVADVGPRLREIRDHAYQKLGETGATADHPTPAYLQGLALSLLEQGDLDGFFNQFAAVDDQRIRDDLARQLGHALGGENLDDTTLAIILRLPAEYREAAAYGVSNGSMGYSDYPETRAALRNWIVNLMENGLKESAGNNVRGLFAKDDPRVNDEIAAWIQTLPTEESWLPVTKELVAGWWAHDDAAMVRGLAALPPGAFRDALLADRAHHALLNPEHYQKPQLDRLLPLIENPKLREKFANWPWGDPYAEPRDDSMPGSDPFKDPTPDPFAVPDK